MIRAIFGALGTFCFVHLGAAYVAWAAGWNFDARGVDVSAAALVILVLATVTSAGMYGRILAATPAQLPASPELEQLRREVQQLLFIEYYLTCRDLPDGIDWPLPPPYDLPNKYLLPSAAQETIDRIKRRISVAESLPRSISQHRLIKG